MYTDEIVILKKYKLLDAIWDLSFIFWFVTEYTISHSTVAQIALALFCAFSILMIRGSSKIRINKIFVLYCIFVGVCYLNVLLDFSIQPYASYSLLKTLIRNLLFMILVYYYADTYGIQHFKKVFTLSTVLATVIIFAHTFVTSRTLILRDNSAVNVNILAICCAIVTCWIICSQKIRFRDALIIGVLLLFCAASGTRKSMLALCVCLSVYFILKQPRKIIINILLSAFAVCLVYMLLIKVPFLYNSIGNRIESLITMLAGGEGDASAETRRGFIELGLEHFKKSPVLGNGINCFKYIKGGYNTYSHNNYIELLFGVGILGIISYYSMYLAILITAIKNCISKVSHKRILAIAFIIALLVVDIGLVSYYERSFVIFIIVCDLLINKGEEDDEQTAEGAQ